jgi:hypothetical protein
MAPIQPTLLAWAARVFGAHAAKRVFAPLVADWRHEVRVASPRRRPAVSLRWSLAFVRVCAATAWRSAWSPAADTPVEWRVSLAMIGFATAGTAILLVPFARWLTRPGVAPFLIYVVPQALALALPFALLPAAVALGRAALDGSTGAARRRLAHVVAATAAVVVLHVGWIVPLANQEWRESMSGRRLSRGLPEHTLFELRAATPVPGVPPALVEREVRRRVLIAVAWPAALAVLGWRIGRCGLAGSVWAQAFWWGFAALMIAVVDGWRHVSRDLPTALAPVLWLAIAALFRPRQLTVAPPGPETRAPAPPRRYFFFGL